MIAGGNQMRRSLVVPGLAVALFGALTAVGAPGSGATPGQAPPPAADESGMVSDTAAPLDVDNRAGHVEPTARQRALGAAGQARTRFNALGTPSVVSAASGSALATGLPADPVAATRAYIDSHLELLGLTPNAAASLDVIAVAPMGEGAAVVLQQRFG